MPSAACWLTGPNGPYDPPFACKAGVAMSHVSGSVTQVGVLLPVLLLLWMACSFWLAGELGNTFFDAGMARLVFKASLVFVLLPLPLIDELIARPGFEARCQALDVSGRHSLTAPGGKLASLLGSQSPLSYSGGCPQS